MARGEFEERENATSVSASAVKICVKIRSSLGSMLLLLSLQAVLGLSLPAASTTSLASGPRHAPRTVVMGPRPRRDLSDVDPEALDFTVRRTAIAVSVLGGALLGLPVLGGKSFDQMNAPGAREAFDEREASKQKWIAEQEERRARLAAQAAADRAAGRRGKPPPKPWEK